MRALAVALLALLLLPAGAGAVIHPATVLEGPSNDILELDGAAMARDGTGGLVYRKQVDGVAHVFAVPFANGAWGAPVEVDGEDAYGASQPAIAAGEHGRLLVVWVQVRNASFHGVKLYELMSASLQPGANAFGPATIVDPNVGEPVTGNTRGVDPSLAMAPSGEAYVVYRVIANQCSAEDPANASCQPSTSNELVEVRVARFNFLSWSSLGAVNRAPQIAMRQPSADNAPSIGIDLSGEGVVAWQEPDEQGVARIWTRRLFGVVQGNVLQASPETIGGRPVSSDAETPVVAVSALGEARVAFRIDGSPGSAVSRTQLFLNSLPSAVGPKASQFTGAVSIPGATGSGLGSPSVGVDAGGDYRITCPVESNVEALQGTAGATGSLLGIGSTTGQTALTAIDPAGGGVTTWPATAGGAAAVDVREDQGQGAYQLAQFGGNIPGAVTGLSLEGSGQGDALLGWTVGQPGRSEIVGDFVQARPAPFNLILPVGWVRGAATDVAWEPATDAVAGTTYAVYVDGHQRIAGLSSLSTSLSTRALGDGVHRVQVVATDPSGQQTSTPTQELKIDVDPPSVHAALIDHGRGVRIRVSDNASGVDASATAIFFGDGTHVRHRARATHVYRRGGSYVILVKVRDRVGNSATDRLHVRIA